MLNSPRVRSCGYSNKSDEACVFPTGNERGRKVSLVYLWRPRTRKLHSCRCPSVSFAYRLSLQSVHFLISLKNKRLRQSTNRINTAAWVGFLFLVSIEFSAFLVFLPLGTGFQILLTDLNFLRYHFSLFWFDSDFIPIIMFFFPNNMRATKKLSIAEITPTLLITSFRRLTVR